MKVIYQFDKKTTELLQEVDAAIDHFIKEHAEEIKRNTFHINPTQRYISECLWDNRYYQCLIRKRELIMNHAIPTVIIVESEQYIKEFILDKLGDSE